MRDRPERPPKTTTPAVRRASEQERWNGMDYSIARSPSAPDQRAGPVDGKISGSRPVERRTRKGGAAVVEHAERDALTSILNTWPSTSGQASKYGERQP